MYRKEYLEALCLLSRAFDLAEKRGEPRPMIVGGSAVEFYTGGEITSGISTWWPSVRTSSARRCSNSGFGARIDVVDGADAELVERLMTRQG